MKNKGQALVEMVLVLPVLLMIVILGIELLFFGSNAFIAKSITARGARAAALSTLPDGVTSCQARVVATVEPLEFFLSDATYTVTNCPADPRVGIAQGSQVRVEIDLTYHSLWLGDMQMTVGTDDYGR